MWHILKAEASYNKFTLFSFFSFCAVCFVIIWYGVKYEHNRVPLTMLIMLVSILNVVFIKDSKMLQDKRNRLYTSLPTSDVKIGLTRLIFPGLLWLSILFLYSLEYVVVKTISHHNLTILSFLQVIFLNGLIILVYTTYLIYIDLKSILTNKKFKPVIAIIWILIYIAAIIPLFVITDFWGLFGANKAVQGYILNLFNSAIGIVGFNILGLIFSGLSIAIFVKRNSYLES